MKKLMASLLAISSMTLCITGLSASADEIEENILNINNGYSSDDIEVNSNLELEIELTEENMISKASSLPYTSDVTLSGDYTTRTFTAPSDGYYNIVFDITTANSSVTVSIGGTSYTYTSAVNQNPFKVYLNKNNSYTVKITKVYGNTIKGQLKRTALKIF